MGQVSKYVYFAALKPHVGLQCAVSATVYRGRDPLRFWWSGLIAEILGLMHSANTVAIKAFWSYSLLLFLLFFITPYTAAHKHTHTKKLKYI